PIFIHLAYRKISQRYAFIVSVVGFPIQLQNPIHEPQASLLTYGCCSPDNAGTQRSHRGPPQVWCSPPLNYIGQEEHLENKRTADQGREETLVCSPIARYHLFYPGLYTPTLVGRGF